MTIELDCKRCNASYVYRNDADGTWNPDVTIPVSTCAYDEVRLCVPCRTELVQIIKDFMERKESV